MWLKGVSISDDGGVVFLVLDTSAPPAPLHTHIFLNKNETFQTHHVKEQLAHGVGYSISDVLQAGAESVWGKQRKRLLKTSIYHVKEAGKFT